MCVHARACLRARDFPRFYRRAPVFDALVFVVVPPQLPMTAEDLPCHPPEDENSDDEEPNQEEVMR